MSEPRQLFPVEISHRPTTLADLELSIRPGEIDRLRIRVNIPFSELEEDGLYFGFCESRLELVPIGCQLPLELVLVKNEYRYRDDQEVDKQRVIGTERETMLGSRWSIGYQSNEQATHSMRGGRYRLRYVELSPSPPNLVWKFFARKEDKILRDSVDDDFAVAHIIEESCEIRAQLTILARHLKITRCLFAGREFANSELKVAGYLFRDKLVQKFGPSQISYSVWTYQSLFGRRN